MIKRYLTGHILRDLRAKMVFISGPRQVGKTTLAKELGHGSFPGKYEYLNWDNRRDRAAIINGSFGSDNKLLIFDEIHKYKNWKNYLKGEYDKYKERFKILVTGSARLDIYRKGGDSLLGRYRAYRLHPLSLAELLGARHRLAPFKELSFLEEGVRQKEFFNRLFTFGGFPEVFIKHSDRELRRWHNEKVDTLVKGDIRDIENVRDLSSLQVLVELLPEKVGSVFSINSLREDLGVTHKTISLWVDILERFYYHFRVYPFQSSRIKSLRKEPKLYLWDWSELRDESARLENMIASHLLKFCDFLLDVQGYKARLYYLRDRERREVDFLVTVEDKPWFCLEVKTAFREISSSLRYFGSRLNVPFVYEVVKEEGLDIIRDNVRVISASKFLSGFV